MAIKFLNSVNADSGVLYVDAANDRVGIGTTSPATSLHVNGFARLAGSLQLAGNNRYVYAINDTDLLLGTYNTERMRITNTGNVGIGVTSPLAKLDIDGGSGKPLKLTTTNNDAIEFRGASSSPFTFIGYNSRGFRFWDSSNSELFRIASNGDITLPKYGAGYLKTDANGLISVDSDTIEDTLQSVTDRGATTSNTIEFTGAANAYVGIQGETDVNLKIGTGAGSEPRIYLFGSDNGQSNAGNIFIGTANNTGMVDINGDVDISGFAGFNGITSPDFPVDISSVDGGKVLRSTRGTSIFRIDQSNDGPGYIGMQSADDLSIQTNNTSKMYITSGGNVGIGTTSPSDKLHIQGSTANIRLVDTSYKSATAGQTAPKITFHLGGNSSEQSASIAEIRTFDDYVSGGAFEGSMAFYTMNGSIQERMRIHSNGNISVGTTNAYARFSVKATSHNNGISVNRQADTTAAIYIGNDGGNNPVLAANNADMLFGRDVSGTFTERMRLTNGGNLGIGTTSPGYRLHLNTNTGTLASFDNGDGAIWSTLTNTKSIGLSSGTNYAAGSNFTWMKLTGGSSGSMIFSVNTERMRIASNGNVGIGTTSPSQKLQVAGIAEVAGALRVTESGTAQHILIGNQDSSGTDKPAMIRGVNGQLHLGHGNSWSGEGGTMTYGISITNGGVQFPQYGAGYLKTDASGNITVDSDIIEDTLDSVTDRGNTTTNSISVGAITLTDDPSSNNGTFVKVYEDEHKRMYVATLDFTFTAAGTYNFNLAFPNSGAFHYELTGVTGRNSNYRNFGTLKDSSYIYWETDEDFTHRAEGDVHLISNYGNGMYFSADTTAFATDGVTDSSQTGTATWSYFVVRYSIYLPDATTGSDGKWKLHLTTYGDTGSSTPQFVLA